jgi:hypothetical protein
MASARARYAGPRLTRQRLRRCNKTGSYEVMVIEQTQNPMRSKPLIGIQPINLAADLAYLADMWKHPLAPIVIFSIDLLWILLVLIAICRSNESQMRKNSRYYDFWRAQHKERVAEELRNRVKLVGWRAKTKAWLKKTGNQIKAQHKLLRIFFVKFDVGEDPANKPTGAQKATVIMSIIMFRMMVSALFCNPAAKETYDKQTVGEAMLTRFLNGMLAAVLTIPATVFLDRMFMKAQRITNKREKNGEESEIARMAKLGLRMVLESAETRSYFAAWQLAVDQIRVDTIRLQLRDSREMRMAKLKHGRALVREAKELWLLAGKHAGAMDRIPFDCPLKRGIRSGPCLHESAGLLILAAAIRIGAIWR